MLHGDVASKASSSAFDRLSFGVNMLGGHCIPWATALIQAETELEHSYSEVYKAANAATERIVTETHSTELWSQRVSNMPLHQGAK